ncbi:MAG: hypothetical protein ACTSPM_05325 [Candidatus Heimdallarchaeota archaeon]
MFKNRKYLRPRIQKAANEFIHVLDEATLLVEALVLQQSGTNLEKYKTLNFKKASIDGLNSILFTLKALIKGKLHFLDDFIDDVREECISKISKHPEFAHIIQHSLQLNLISDNNDVSLYLAPYIVDWDLLTAGVQALIINHTIRSINQEIQRTQLAEKIAGKF